jgi:hypothetical protein
MLVLSYVCSQLYYCDKYFCVCDHLSSKFASNCHYIMFVFHKLMLLKPLVPVLIYLCALGCSLSFTVLVMFVR